MSAWLFGLTYLALDELRTDLEQLAADERRQGSSGLNRLLLHDFLDGRLDEDWQQLVRSVLRISPLAHRQLLDVLFDEAPPAGWDWSARVRVESVVEQIPVTLVPLAAAAAQVLRAAARAEPAPAMGQVIYLPGPRDGVARMAAQSDLPPLAPDTLVGPGYRVTLCEADGELIIYAAASLPDDMAALAHPLVRPGSQLRATLVNARSGELLAEVVVRLPAPKQAAARGALASVEMLAERLGPDGQLVWRIQPLACRT